MYIGALRALFAEAALGVSASTDTDTPEWQCRDVLH
jgi:hypothetical protein